MNPAEAQERADRPDVAGTWVGTLDAAGQELSLVFHIARGVDGRLSGTMDSPDQGAYGLALSAVEAEDDGSVRFEFAMAGGEYTGRLSAEGDAITGTWSQGGASFPLLLGRGDAEALAPKRPQEPQPPFPYEALEVGFDNPGAGVRLAGTLTIPVGDGPHPAVALISGSGPQDRDGTVFGHRPFLVLADYLTRRGIAVLRYDDRGIGESTGNLALATTPDFASDALAAVAFLTARPDVNPVKIGLVGHSEGANVAPIAASQNDEIAFVVLLAGTGVTGRELLVMQAKAINRASGVSEGVIEQRARIQGELLDVVMAAEDDSAAVEGARVILAEAGLSGDAAEAQIRGLLSPWMKHFLSYDPLPELRQLSIPVLALNGEKDTQVPPTENLLPVEEALREGGNRDVTAEVLPGLNHLFQTAETGAPTEYVRIEETMSPAALVRIADWIAERAGIE
ncbi:MAG: alpha/beta fold hydrolase [Gemmatimonadetes bacterium]|nr:alpha/beta fold hydrolase [Gemmatimonadota bacterium]